MAARAKLYTLVSLLALIVTTLWLVLLIAGVAGGGPPDTFDQVLAHISEHSALFTWTYLNATLTVLAAAALFAVLYLCCRSIAPELALIGLVFVPVYAVLNLLVYAPQLTVVPAMLGSVGEQQPGYESARLLLGQLVQLWPASGVSFLSNLGYAILGVPSIIFGLILAQRQGALRWAGILLALSGVACILGLINLLLGNPLPGSSSLAGGALYLLALILLSIAFWRGR